MGLDPILSNYSCHNNDRDVLVAHLCEHAHITSDNPIKTHKSNS